MGLAEPNGQKTLPMYPSVLVLFLGRDVLGDEGSGSASAGGDVSAGARMSIISGIEGSGVGPVAGGSMTGAVSTRVLGVGFAAGVSTTGAGGGTRWGRCKARVLLISWIDKCKVSSSVGCLAKLSGMRNGRRGHTVMEGV